MQHAKVDADWTGYKIGIGVSATSSVNGTCIHAGSTSKAFQSLNMFFVGENIASSIVNKYDMHFTSLTWLAIVRGIGG
jgi:hypothetical protein